MKRIGWLLLVALFTLMVGVVSAEEAARFSAKEIAVLYEEDFAKMPVGRFPVGWQIRSNEDATPNYKVVEFPKSASGRALHAFNGGITWGNMGHALIIAPGIAPLTKGDSKILVESTIWIDKGAIWRSYLFPAGIVWPPYKDISSTSATTPIDHTDLQRHVVQHVYDPTNATIETYFDYVLVDSGSKTYRDATLKTYPTNGKQDYNIGIYTQGLKTTEMYWEHIRVAELAR